MNYFNLKILNKSLSQIVGITSVPAMCIKTFSDRASEENMNLNLQETFQEDYIPTTPEANLLGENEGILGVLVPTPEPDLVEEFDTEQERVAQHYFRHVVAGNHQNTPLLPDGHRLGLLNTPLTNVELQPNIVTTDLLPEQVNPLFPVIAERLVERLLIHFQTGTDVHTTNANLLHRIMGSSRLTGSNLTIPWNMQITPGMENFIRNTIFGELYNLDIQNLPRYVNFVDILGGSSLYTLGRIVLTGQPVNLYFLRSGIGVIYSCLREFLDLGDWYDLRHIISGRLCGIFQNDHQFLETRRAAVILFERVPRVGIRLNQGFIGEFEHYLRLSHIDHQIPYPIFREIAFEEGFLENTVSFFQYFEMFPPF